MSQKKDPQAVRDFIYTLLNDILISSGSINILGTNSPSIDFGFPAADRDEAVDIARVSILANIRAVGLADPNSERMEQMIEERLQWDSRTKRGQVALVADAELGIPWYKILGNMQSAITAMSLPSRLDTVPKISTSGLKDALFATPDITSKLDISRPRRIFPLTPTDIDVGNVVNGILKKRAAKKAPPAKVLVLDVESPHQRAALDYTQLQQNTAIAREKSGHPQPAAISHLSDIMRRLEHNIPTNKRHAGAALKHAVEQLAAALDTRDSATIERSGHHDMLDRLSAKTTIHRALAEMLLSQKNVIKAASFIDVDAKNLSSAPISRSKKSVRLSDTEQSREFLRLNPEGRAFLREQSAHIPGLPLLLQASLLETKPYITPYARSIENHSVEQLLANKSSLPQHTCETLLRDHCLQLAAPGR